MRFRLVERARMILTIYQLKHMGKTAQVCGCHVDTVRLWVTRFEEQSIAGLQDAPRPGRPPTYSEEEKGALIALARTNPQALELDFGQWTLDQLVEYLREHHQSTISRAQLARVLDGEGLRWYQEKVYFSERPDPQFAEKRGPSSRFTSSPQPIPLLSV